jgi:hypothetical protein
MIKIDTHSRRKFIYVLIDAVGFFFLLSIIVLVIGQKTRNESIEKFNVIFVIFFFIGFAWILIRIFIGRAKWYKPIDKTGEIAFYEDYLIFNNIRIHKEQIKTIRIGVTQCKGQPAGGRSGLSDGTGNYIELFLKDKSRLKERLLIDNLQQVNDLKLHMDSWKNTGILIIGYWKPFLHIFEK